MVKKFPVCMGCEGPSLCLQKLAILPTGLCP